MLRETSADLSQCLCSKESFEKAINVQDDTPETIKRVLSFRYLREHDDEDTAQFQLVSDMPPLQEMNSNSSISDNELDDRQSTKKAALNNIQVFIAADKFGIAPLKSLATEEGSHAYTHRHTQ
jgi:hypothetical protein